MDFIFGYQRNSRIRLLKNILTIACLYYIGVSSQTLQLSPDRVNEADGNVILSNEFGQSENSVFDKKNDMSIAETYGGNSFDYAFLKLADYMPINMKTSKFLVSIRTRGSTEFFGNGHFCNGVMISNLIVLSAARCFIDQFGAITRIHQIVVMVDCPIRLDENVSCIPYDVEYIIPHAGFQRNHEGNDIAVLILKDNYKPPIRPLHVLPLSRNPPKIYQECRTFSWDQLFWNGRISYSAIHMKTIIQPVELCMGNYTYSTNDVLCAGGPQWDSSTCHSYSGSVLICNGKLAGLATEKQKCSLSKTIRYTSVSYHYKWILQKAKARVVLRMNIILEFAFLIILIFL